MGARGSVPQPGWGAEPHDSGGTAKALMTPRERRLGVLVATWRLGGSRFPLCASLLIVQDHARRWLHRAGEAAVDDELVAGDVGAGVRRQEQRRARDLRGLAPAMQRGARHHALDEG